MFNSTSAFYNNQSMSPSSLAFALLYNNAAAITI